MLATAAVAAVLTAGGVAVAQIATGVSNPQPRSGSPANVLAAGYKAVPVAVGKDALENPIGIFKTYGFLDDHATQASGLDTKTEPDQNTYLVTDDNPGGPTEDYDYGRHFLIQGHEVFAGSHAYFTRVNLDVRDPDHRITLLNTPAVNGDTSLTSIDGSTYDPFNGQLLFTAEAGNKGGVVSTPLAWSSTSIPALKHLDGSFGQAGYEGIHPDSKGTIYIVEDTGGATVTDGATATKVKQPNSFVYRFKPAAKDDLEHGRLQALQVLVDDDPITFHDGAKDPAGPRNDALGDQIKALHSGDSLDARWITLHNTATDGTTAFDANALAKAKGATPLKRPENGSFVPGTGFRSFVFVETGDTNKDAGNYPGAAERGAWGAILRIDMPFAGSNNAEIATIARGDQTHNSFDNTSFLDECTLLVSEDRGDSLHQQLNVLDSLWSFDLTDSIDDINGSAKRLVAQGRDTEATKDAANHEATPPVTDQNDGDNEVTGNFVSDGSTSIDDLLGTNDPGSLKGVRIFFTQQHGENITYEINPRQKSPKKRRHGGWHG